MALKVSGCKAFKAFKETKELLELKAKVYKVSMEPKVIRASKETESKVFKASWDCRDLSPKDPKELRASKVCPVARRASTDSKAHRATEDFRVMWVKLAHRVSKELLAPTDYRATKAMSARTDFRDSKETLEQTDYKARLDFREVLGFRDWQAMLGCKEMLGLMGYKALLDSKGTKGWPGLLVLREMMDFRELSDSKVSDCKVCKETKAMLDCKEASELRVQSASKALLVKLDSKALKVFRDFRAMVCKAS